MTTYVVPKKAFNWQYKKLIRILGQRKDLKQKFSLSKEDENLSPFEGVGKYDKE